MATLGDNLTDDEADDMIKDADTNGDGKVDYQEFSRMVKQKQWFWDSDLYNQRHIALGGQFRQDRPIFTRDISQKSNLVLPRYTYYDISNYVNPIRVYYLEFYELSFFEILLMLWEKNALILWHIPRECRAHFAKDGRIFFLRYPPRAVWRFSLKSGSLDSTKWTISYLWSYLCSMIINFWNKNNKKVYFSYESYISNFEPIC